MPYRIDIPEPPQGLVDDLIDLGALDIEFSGTGLAAILPDSVDPAHIQGRLQAARMDVSPAVARDEGSVWLLTTRPFRLGSLRVAPPGSAEADLYLIDSPAFGTGHHPTTALCAEMLEEAIAQQSPPAILDVGTGTGILALVALKTGAREATAIDIDSEALEAAARNARINGMEGRLRLVHGGPESITGIWPLVVANVLAAPLIELSPVLVQRVESRGRLILSGVPSALEAEVGRAYKRLGMNCLESRERGGWIATLLQASW